MVFNLKSLGLGRRPSRRSTRRILNHRPAVANSARRWRTPQIDPLEQRCLLAMTYTLVPLGDVAGGDFFSGSLYISDATANSPVRITGFGTDGTGETATLFDFTSETLNNLGRLPGKTHAQATGVNAEGYVVGRSGGSDSTIFIGSLEAGDRGWIYDPVTETFTEFGDFEGGNGWSTATAINRANQVTGYASSNDAAPTFQIGPQAFLWAPVSQEEIQRIGFTGGNPTSGSFQLKFFNDVISSDSIPWNASALEVQQALESLSYISPGDVDVSLVNDPNQPEARWEVRFTNNLTNVNLPVLQPFNVSLDQGSVGVATVQDGSLAGMHRIDVGAYRSLGEDVNNAGVVVGARDMQALVAGHHVEAFVWDPIRSMRPLVVNNLDVDQDGKQFSIANAINNLGFVVGDAVIEVFDEEEEEWVSVGQQWGYWDTNLESPVFNPMFPLIEIENGNPRGAHYSTALAVNNRALPSVVGAARLNIDGDSDNRDERAWVFHFGRASLLQELEPNESENYRAMNLNDHLDASGDGWILRYATGINDLGQIVGIGINPQGDQEAFLLLPVNTRPELSTIEHKVAEPGQPLTWTVTATDADGDNLRFVLHDAPDGMVLTQLDNWTAEITWTPGLSSPSQVSFTVTVQDDGHTEIKNGQVQWTSHSRTGHVAVQKSLLFFEDFESSDTLGPAWSAPTTTNDGFVGITTGQSVGSGNQGLLFHSSVENASVDVSAIVLNIDLSTVAAGDRVILSFYQLEGTLGSLTPGEQPTLQNPVHAIAASGDGVAIRSETTGGWYNLRDVQANAVIDRQGDGLWHLFEYDLTSEIDRIKAEIGVTHLFTNTFQIKFSRRGQLSFPNEGFVIDDIKIYNQGNFVQENFTPDVFHRIDTGDKEELYRVAFFGNVDANTPILVSVHGAGREIYNHTRDWQRFVADPANGVDGLIVVAPYFAAGGKFDDYGLLSWNNQNDTAADESLLNFIDNLTTITGVGDSSQLYLFGFSRGAHFVEAFTAARPDRVAAVVAAAADRQTFPLDDIEYPYGIKPFLLFSPPPEVTLDAAAYLSHRMMIWVGQDDVTEVTDQSDPANLQGLLRTDRSVNMFRTMHEVAALHSLTPADYELELYVQQNRSHLDLFLPEDLTIFYEFLFRPELSPPLNDPIEVRPIVVAAPTAGDQQENLPIGLDTLQKNSEYWIEIWVQTPGTPGITTGSVGLVFDTDLMNVLGFEHGSLFTEDTTGSFSNLDARVSISAAPPPKSVSAWANMHYWGASTSRPCATISNPVAFCLRYNAASPRSNSKEVANQEPTCFPSPASCSTRPMSLLSLPPSIRSKPAKQPCSRIWSPASIRTVII